jgi:hypothetical protein
MPTRPRSLSHDTTKNNFLLLLAKISIISGIGEFGSRRAFYRLTSLSAANRKGHQAGRAESEFGKK